MAVREVEDRSGRRWRAWDISPDAIHPQTKAEDYLADCFQLGWIVFETFDGSDKRRLCPYPKNWEELPEDQLLALLERAERVPLSKLARERIARADTPGAVPAWHPNTDDQPTILPANGEDALDVTDLRVTRSFRYPSGSVWSATVVRPEPTEARVLRFSAGGRHFDLAEWPREWPDYPNERLVELLRSAAPRAPGAAPPPGAPGRRYDDTRP